ncbi:SMI1/KNR4 family protein [Chitinophaga agrisoli]|uniref:SMI1/KNR4 family protein n=1 Tax=Chitinophaga agrisoli TaxID=2607653 RepID=A0A5B2VME6_9BACT|nr:SMI1/KNR4 family protein [Chitinophaga agrisoli]KAA2239820.1 SMI1/KNR4 family protein [Chitinophaga agrisoli]
MSVFEDLQLKLEQNNAPILQFLNPGLTRADIEASLARFKFTISAELFSLYEWHDGAKLDETVMVREQWLFDTYLFPSLDRMKELYNDTATDKYIKLSHLPIMDDIGGPMLLLECNEKSKQYGMILEYDVEALEYDTIITKYDSITTLLQTISERYRSNLINIKNADDYLEVEKIGKALNPKSKFWKLA